ncbi:hypothetical protein EQG49_02325 [Periweissella cryptocerci]|uniref:Uncharacterized protein n=1 Tax=Periweissella cryptocerci TaxID=2506420 RepID=A0A4P6YS06_9LACO|nr:hypothetical protein [Periweissella cryptocerci]QBO35383.1 hypothetical protein EQG49_02325 [Periweissella cryptocerci]
MSVSDDLDSLLHGTLDDKLEVLEAQTRAELKAKILAEDVPKALEFTILPVTMKKLNRLNSQGVSSFTSDDESYAFEADDWAEFDKVINTWIELNGEVHDGSRRGKISFY